ncbi:MAG: hypothetical protein QOF48_3536 [Verrucomicrobiota bacterium]|jgi:integrase
MKHDAIQSSTQSAVYRARSHRTGTYQKALDGRKRPVRGLWVRNGRYYAQLAVEDFATGQKSVRRIPLTTKDTKEPVTTAAEAVAALQRLKVERIDRTLPVLRQTPKFNDYVETYLASVKVQSKKPGTIAKEKGQLSLWAGHLKDTRLDRITRPMITAFIEKRSKANIGSRTLNLDVIALRNVLKAAMDDGWIKALPTQGMRPLKHTTVKRPLKSLADIDRLCEAAKSASKNGELFCDYIRLLTYTGARRNEALQIRWQDVDFDRKQITIGALGDTKNRTGRHVDFNTGLEALLKSMKARRAPDTQWLFPSPQRGDKDRSTKTFKESLNLALKMLSTDGATLKFGFHDCRHLFISKCVMAGVDFMTIAEWVGHQDGGVLIGKIYGHLADGHKKAMAGKVIFEPSLSA